MTHCDDSQPVCSVETIQLTNDERNNVHFCSECDVETDSIANKPDKSTSKKGETRVNAVQTTERQTTKCKVPTVEEFIVQPTTEAYCREATQVGMSGSELHVDYS